MLKSVGKKNVKLLPGLFRERMETERGYISELETQCLLQNFYLEAGVVMPGLQVLEDPSSAKLHWGWEAPTCQLRGHFLGHWLSAAAAIFASEGDAALKSKLDFIIAELARCQKLNGGKWAGSIPEKYFNKMITGDHVWSPQYVMHKTIMGLADAYADAGSEQALEVLSNLADWYTEWIAETEKVSPYAVCKGESGGMLEAWARAYELTRDEKYLKLAEKYSGAGMFTDLEKGGDPLTNCHANASIPLSHGAAKLYEVTGDEKWLERVKLFWQSAVEKRGMYCTGGANAGEFWVPPYRQAEFLSAADQEFCTVYNMVRTADFLYRVTGEAKYADYIELCLYNGFLAQQNPYTGTPTYFLPLKAGSKKKWGSKTHDFWCCHGTMVQAQTIYPDLIYFIDDDTNRLSVAQYISSQADFELAGAKVHFEQTSDMKYYNDQAFFDERDDGRMNRWALKFNVNTDKPADFELALRLPCWVSGEVKLSVNGESVQPEIRDGFIILRREWGSDEIKVFFPSKINMQTLPDSPELCAAVDGPIVLAGITDSDCGISGDISKPEEIFAPLSEHTYGTFPWKQTCYRTKNQQKNIEFKPLYDIVDEVYTVYFTHR